MTERENFLSEINTLRQKVETNSKKEMKKAEEIVRQDCEFKAN